MKLFKNKKKKIFFSRSDARFLDRVSNGVTVGNSIHLVFIGIIIAIGFVGSLFIIAHFGISIGFWGWVVYGCVIIGLIGYLAWRF